MEGGHQLSVVMLVIPTAATTAAFSRQLQFSVVLRGNIMQQFSPRGRVPVLSEESAVPAGVV